MNKYYAKMNYDDILIMGDKLQEPRNIELIEIYHDSELNFRLLENEKHFLYGEK